MRSVALAALLLGTATAQAAQSIDVEQYPGKTAGRIFYYAAKFVCGKLPTSAHPGLVPGLYQTAVNVHNPNAGTLKFRWKAVIANSASQPHGAISPFTPEALKPDEALEIDCSNIAKVLGVQLGGEKGFVVIETVPSRQLDVVGVYTAAGG